MATQCYMTPTEAAEFLRTSVSTLAKRRMRGKGPTFVRLGRSIRYRIADLEEFVSNTQQVAGQQFTQARGHA